MAVVRLVVVGVLAAVSSACLNSSTLITVAPDGSGTVDQTVLVNPQAAPMMGGIGSPSAGTNPALFDEAELRQAATRLGAGVRFVSATPHTADGFEGVKVRYAFDDINTLRVDQEPRMPGPDGAAQASTSPLTFTLDRGPSSSVLTIDMNPAPGQPARAGDPASAPPLDPAMVGMFRSLFKGARVDVALQVAGTIVRTNADHVSGSRVTLFALDLEALLTDSARLGALQPHLGAGASIADLRPHLADTPGVTLNQPVITLEIR